LLLECRAKSVLSASESPYDCCMAVPALGERRKTELASRTGRLVMRDFQLREHKCRACRLYRLAQHRRRLSRQEQECAIPYRSCVRVVSIAYGPPLDTWAGPVPVQDVVWTSWSRRDPRQNRPRCSFSMTKSTGCRVVFAGRMELKAWPAYLTGGGYGTGRSFPWTYLMALGPGGQDEEAIDSHLERKRVARCSLRNRGNGNAAR